MAAASYHLASIQPLSRRLIRVPTTWHVKPALRNRLRVGSE